MNNTALYANVGSSLVHFDVDIDACRLVRRGAITLPSYIQYAWRHDSLPVLYVCCTDRTGKGVAGSNHFLCAVKIDQKTGAPSMHGEPVRLVHRPLHVSTDSPTRNVLVSFNKPACLRVFRTRPDGSLGEEVPQREDIDFGTYPHQARVTADNRLAVLVTRGNPMPDHGPVQKDPGALKVFEYKDGVLGREVSVTVGDGMRYGPRHLDFHPNGKWVFVSLEIQNELYVHQREGDAILPVPSHTRKLLANPDVPPAGLQLAGTVHFHPKADVVYCVNRAYYPEMLEGRKVVMKPDNTLVVYSVDPSTGEPTLLQHIDSAGLCPRTFSIDPTGRMLVTANAAGMLVKQTDADEVRMMPAGLGMFRVMADGRLEFKGKFDVELGPKEKLFWTAFVPY